jgi:amidase
MRFGGICTRWMSNEQMEESNMFQHLNAFVKEDYTIEPTGDGLLNGLTFAVKDVFGIQGYANTAGNPDWHRTHGLAAQNAVVIDLLLGQGAWLKGITHTDELMYSLNGENDHYGTPVNPRAPDRIPGGSSSGSASAAAAGAANFALGTDTGGSVRVPSAYCGLYGIRPTHGTVSVEGVIPLSPSFDTVGWMANDTKVMLDVGRVLLPEHEREGEEFSRFYFCKDVWETADESCRNALLRQLPRFEPFTGKSEWITVAPEGLASWGHTFRTIQGFEIWSSHGEWINRERPHFGSGIAERFAWAGTVKRDDFVQHLQVRLNIRQTIDTLLGEDGVLVIPTVPCVAPKTGLIGEEIENIRSRTMQLSCLAGLSGLPQVTIPFDEPNGLPVGLSLIAGRRQDIRLLHWIHRTMSKLP